MVNRVNGSSLIRLGEVLHGLSQVKTEQSIGKNALALSSGKTVLAQFLGTDTLFQLRVSRQKGQELLRCLESLANKNWNDELDPVDVAGLTRLVDKFQMLLKEELDIANLYLVSRNRGYSTEALIESPSDIFPPSLLEYVPDAARDVQQVGRCLAFEVPTAAAFHLHRINEAVLRRYFAAIAPEAAPLKNGHMGAYLAELRKLSETVPKPSELETLLPLLKSIKDHYRNPVMHPDRSIDSIDQAFALLSLINAAVELMFVKIEEQPKSEGRQS